MNGEDDQLLAVATSVSDGIAVDWPALEEGASTDAERKVIQHLKTVSNIARVLSSQIVGADSEMTQMTGTLGMPSMKPHGGGPMLERWGHLEIREKVGQGGFGEVYRAWDPTLEREVALKLLRMHRHAETAEASDASIVQEGRNMARVRHPNSVVVHGAAKNEGRVGLWMEFVQGQTLEGILRQQGQFGAREAAVVGLDVLRALAAVHGAGIVHRDVKAQNVMREEGGRIVLMDFGAGSAVRPEGSGSSTDNAGTPLYMAPELLRGGESSVRSDIYGLGVLLYHLVTNAYPYEGSTLTELVRAHDRPSAGALRDARPDLPRAFVEIVEKALAPNPADRYASAGEMERALADAVRPRRSLWVIALAGALGAAALIAGGLGLRHVFSGEYTVQATMYRVEDGTRTQLASGDRVHVGNDLAVEFAASRRVWVYVINEDENGEQYVLFPMKGYDLQNPLPARDEPYVLPGSFNGERKYWTVTSAGGRERFLVEASPEPDTKLEQRIASVPTAGEGQPVKLPRTRGVGTTRSGPETKRVEPESLIDAINVLSSKPETATGIWKRIIELDNPAH